MLGAVHARGEQDWKSGHLEPFSICGSFWSSAPPNSDTPLDDDGIASAVRVDRSLMVAALSGGVSNEAHRLAGVFSEDLAQAIGDVTHCGVGCAGGDDRGH